MRASDRMKLEHGTVKEALEICAGRGLTRAEIAHKYGCSPNSIKDFALRYGVDVLPTVRTYEKGKCEYKQTAGGLTDTESRKAMTAAILRGEELSRANILGQVKHYKPNSPEFAAVAADIMRQRELCRPIDLDTVERMI